MQPELFAKFDAIVEPCVALTAEDGHSVGISSNSTAATNTSPPPASSPPSSITSKARPTTTTNNAATSPSTAASDAPAPAASPTASSSTSPMTAATSSKSTRRLENHRRPQRPLPHLALHRPALPTAPGPWPLGSPPLLPQPPLPRRLAPLPRLAPLRLPPPANRRTVARLSGVNEQTSQNGTMTTNFLLLKFFYRPLSSLEALRMQIGKIFEQQAVDEDVTSARFLEKD
jgi:hypothetical protein